MLSILFSPEMFFCFFFCMQLTLTRLTAVTVGSVPAHMECVTGWRDNLDMIERTSASLQNTLRVR